MPYISLKENNLIWNTEMPSRPFDLHSQVLLLPSTNKWFDKLMPHLAIKLVISVLAAYDSKGSRPFPLYKYK